MRRSGRTDEPISGSEDRRCPRAEIKNSLYINGDSLRLSLCHTRFCTSTFDFWTISRATARVDACVGYNNIGIDTRTIMTQPNYGRINLVSGSISKKSPQCAAPFLAQYPFEVASGRSWRKAAVHHDELFLIAQRASAAGRSANIVVSSADTRVPRGRTVHG